MWLGDGCMLAERIRLLWACSAHEGASSGLPTFLGGVQLAAWQLEVAGSTLQKQHAWVPMLMHQ